MAKTYSKEGATRDASGILSNVDVMANKITTTLFYKLHDLPEHKVVMIEDNYGYHFVKILKKTKIDITKIKDTPQIYNPGLEDYTKYKYFLKLYKEYDVVMTYMNYEKFLQRPPETEVFRIGNEIIQKKDFITMIPQEIVEDPMYKIHAQASSIAPLVERVLRDMLAKKEAKKMSMNKKIKSESENIFQQMIVNKWIDDISAQIDVSDIKKEILQKTYVKNNFKSVNKVQFSMLLFDDKELPYAVNNIKNTQEYKKYASVNTSRVNYTPVMYEGNIPKDYAMFTPYLNAPVDTILPVMDLKDYKIISMVYSRVSEPLITYGAFENAFMEMVKQKRFYEVVVDSWKNNKDLKLKKDIVDMYENLIKELNDNTFKKLENQ